MSVNDGGPAFPSGAYTHGHQEDGTPVILPWHSGLSIRDWFAGQAMSTMIHLSEDGRGWDPVAVAAGCYAVADAMLAAREPTP